MIILTRSEIEALIDFDAAAKAIEVAYVATSLGRVNLPPIGHITFPDGADCYIRYGCRSQGPDQSERFTGTWPIIERHRPLT